MANRYFVNGGVNNNWSTTGNWSTTSGGAGGSSVPTAADDVFFDANSPNCTVNTSTRSALSLNFTGYTNTITMDAGINCAGNVTLSSGMTVSGTGNLSITANSTLTSNGKTWGNLALNTTATITLADAWTVAALTCTNNVNVTLNGFTLSVTGDCNLTGFTTTTMKGSTQIILNGTGTLNLPSIGSGGVRCELVINTSGTITISPTVNTFGGTFSYIAGTVVTTGSTLSLTNNAGASLNTNGITWDNVIFGASVTHVLDSPLQVSGTLTLGTTSSTTYIIAGDIGCVIEFSGSSLTSTITTGVIIGFPADYGLTIVKITNTCSVGSDSFTTGRISVPHLIDAPGKTITINNKWITDINNWAYVAGSVVTSDGSWTTGGGGGSSNFSYASS